MAGKTGLKEQEYSSLETQIQEVHIAILTGVRAALGRLEELNQTGGGFYVKELTPKVSVVIEQMREILSLLETIYSAHEDIIDSFQRSIENYDKCC